MGNDQSCACLNKHIKEESKTEYVVGSRISDNTTRTKDMSTKKCKYEIDSESLHHAFNDCSFTRNTEEVNSKSIQAFNTEVDQLSFIQYKSEKQL